MEERNLLIEQAFSELSARFFDCGAGKEVAGLR
jgi:hypothetical protein